MSGENALLKENKWCELRISCGRVKVAEKLLSATSLGYYIPYRYTKKSVNGKKKLILESLLSCFIFVYASVTDIENLNSIQLRAIDKPCLSFYYYHFAKTSLGKNPPFTVSHSAMDIFIRLNSVRSEHIVIWSHDRYSPYPKNKLLSVVDLSVVSEAA